MFGWKRELLALDQRQLRPAARELGDRQLGLELAEARARGSSGCRGRRRGGGGRSRGRGRRRSGSGKTDGVAARPRPATGRASRPRAGRRRRAVAGRVVTRRQTRTEGSKRSVSSTAPGISARVGDDALPARAVLEQAPHEVADQVVRRLVAGEAQREAGSRRSPRSVSASGSSSWMSISALVRSSARRSTRSSHQPAQVAAVGGDVLARARPAPRAPGGPRSAPAR